MKKALVSIFTAGCLIFMFSGCETGSASVTEPQVVTEPAATITEPVFEAKNLDELYADMLENISDHEINSSGRADAIAIYAKKAAKTGSEDIGNEAVLFIVNNYPNYYDSNEMMEKTMLCGYYLEYLDYSDRVAQLGMDVEQAVKYVYRGVETAEDDATKENLNQIWEIIESSKLG